MEKVVEYTLNDFNPLEIDSIFEVYESNQSYFVLSGGAPATIKTIHENREEIPPIRIVDLNIIKSSSFIKTLLGLSIMSKSILMKMPHTLDYS